VSFGRLRRIGRRGFFAGFGDFAETLAQTAFAATEAILTHAENRL
jgi:hypothetical protein